MRISDWSSDVCSSDLFDDHGRPQALLGSYSKRYPDTLRQELLILQRQPDTPLTLRDLVRLDSAIGDCFAQTANILLQQVDIPADAIAAIGSHGQTLFHDPQTLGSSLQLGDPNRIAALTGIRRPEERSVGKEVVSKGRSRWAA